jgi:Primase C terminal 2 (PriCT-2)
VVTSYTDVSVDTVRKAIHQYVRTRNKDVSDYADWLDVGMRLHHQLGGSEEGLDIWDEWSSTDTSKRDDGSPRYQGRATLKAKWKSFSSEPGKRTVGMESLIARLPATSDEYDIEEGDSRPVITLGGGELHNIAMKCEGILSPYIFVREHQLVRVGGGTAPPLLPSSRRYKFCL